MYGYLIKRVLSEKISKLTNKDIGWEKKDIKTDILAGKFKKATKTRFLAGRLIKIRRED